LKISALALSAALLGLASITPASAVTPSSVGHAIAQQGVVTPVAQKKVIVKKRNGVVTKKVVHRNHKYRAGGRYKHAPGGWHRYDKRPGDWGTRGCIIVGPVWWCP
jgi:hypothetical protein